MNDRQNQLSLMDCGFHFPPRGTRGIGNATGNDWRDYLMALRARSLEWLRGRLEAEEQVDIVGAYRVYSLLAQEDGCDESLSPCNWNLWKITAEVAAAKFFEGMEANERSGDAAPHRGRAALSSLDQGRSSKMAAIFTEVLIEQLENLAPEQRLVAFLRLNGMPTSEVAGELNCSVAQVEESERRIALHWTSAG